MRRERTQTHRVPAHIFGPRTLLLLSTLALLLIGLVMVYSASSVSAITEASDPSQANAASYLIDQLKFLGVGVLCALALWKIPYELWRGPIFWAVWGLVVALILLTAAVGTTSLGAQRWLSIGPFSFQPSEFVKIALVLMMARIFAEFREGHLDSPKMYLEAFFLVLCPLGILFITQSDLGTTAIILLGVLAVLWLGEAPKELVFGLIIVGVILGICAIVFTSYRSDRMLYLNPWDDGEGGRGRGYQIIHSYYAFSEGGLFGVGLGNSAEKFLYLPEAETDFIFSIIGEEFGMVGALFVIACYLVFCYAGLQIARGANDAYGTMISGALTIMIVGQAFLNIGCVIGVFPTTGKPLPFISSGGSSLVATLMMVGLIMSVSRESDHSAEYERRRNDLCVIRAVDNPRTRSRTGSYQRSRMHAQESMHRYRDGLGSSSRLQARRR